jgi:hypothetical protein
VNVEEESSIRRVISIDKEEGKRERSALVLLELEVLLVLVSRSQIT